MVSISPVPKLEPGPVSYIQLQEGALPAGPAKSSSNTVVQPVPGAGGALSARAAVPTTVPPAVSANTAASTATAVIRRRRAISRLRRCSRRR